jgi:MoaA/NifB/PqqE/SkfB family radical SAM enzyme
MPSEISVFLFLTEQCNLTCDHCYVSSGPKRTVTMPAGTIAKALDVFGASGADDFRLTGGEPSLHPEFETVINDIAKRGHRVRLVSNGKRLFGNSNAKHIFALLDACWISAYGTTPERHERVAGTGALSLRSLELWVGELTAEGFRVGLSVLLSPGDLDHIEELLERTSVAGIRRLRLLPLEPDGRATSNPNTAWAGWPTELQAIYDLLARYDWSTRFDTLTLNDPFDLGNRFIRGPDSCLLHSRRMWSVVPNGDIYSCCFNVYQEAHKVGNVADPHVDNLLSGWDLPLVKHPCRAFEESYWRHPLLRRVTCPISALSVLKGNSLPPSPSNNFVAIRSLND